MIDSHVNQGRIRASGDALGALRHIRLRVSYCGSLKLTAAQAWRLIYYGILRRRNPPYGQDMSAFK